jgi:hypothetical protein
VRAAAAFLGAAMLALPALFAPGLALALTGAALLLLAASLVPRAGSWPWAATLAASAPVIECVTWPPGTAVLAVEGLLVLGYLVLLDGPAGPGRAGHPAARHWLRGQVRYGIAGLAAAGVVAAALAVPAAVSPWTVLAGLAAAAAAYLVALPRRPRSPE